MRTLVAVAPFAILAALAAHQIHFGDDHEFGGDAHEAIVTLGLVGLAAVLAFLSRLGTQAARAGAEGSLVAARLARVFPGGGRLGSVAASVWLLGLATYASVEAAEGRCTLSGLAIPALTIAVLGIVQAFTLRALVRFIASATLALAGPTPRDRARRFPKVFVAAPRLPQCDATFFAHERGLRAPPVSS